MLTKEQILEKHCSAEPNEADTYLDFRHNTIDGSSDHVLAAMEEYAEQAVEEDNTTYLFVAFLLGEYFDSPEDQERINKAYNEFLDGISYT